VLWVEVLLVFIVCHLVGDFLLQTDWQARHKHGGLGRDPVARRALLAHVTAYTLVFVPAVAWVVLTADLPVATGVLLLALVFLPHLLQDDGRVVRWWMHDVKRTDPSEQPGVTIVVDQTMHIVMLFALAVIIALIT
jgi:hypothetical protein